MPRFALAALAVLTLVAPAAGQSADTIQARLAEALDDLVQAERLSAEDTAATRAEAEARWGHAVDLYAAVLTDVETVDLPPAARDEVVRLALYNTACAQARLGRDDVALTTLNRALEAGYQDFARIEQDPDLAGLREHPRFVQLLERARAALAAAAQAEASKVLSPDALFDFDFDVTTLDGRRLTKADLAGKVVIVDYWGTWCPPCMQEIPHFVALRQKFGDQLAVVGMTWERGARGPEAEAKVKATARRLGIDYPLTMVSDDLLRDLQIEAFPTTLFLDKGGRVRAREVGYRDQGTLEALVQALLDEPTPRARPRGEGGQIGPF